MMANVSPRNMEPFQNPDDLPLEDLRLNIKTDGVVKRVKALDETWADERYFLHYEAPKIYHDDGTEIIGAKDCWMETVRYIIADLKWLLSLPYYRFWSNIVFNNSILDSLVSFLQEAPPFYALENFPNCPEMLELLETLCHNVLVVFARLVTNKESSKEYMSRLFLGNLLYDKYIFTVPIIFDLCQLYGRENPKAMENILTSLFTLKPSYNEDLQRAVPCLIEAFENVEVKFQDCPVAYIGEAVSLSKRVVGSSEMTLLQLEDMILYILDILSTVNVLLRNYPPAVSIFHREDFMNKIVQIYENTIPEMYKKLHKLGYNNECMPKYIEIKHRLDVTRIELLNLFRIILYHPILSIHEEMNVVTEEDVKKRLDEYIHLLSNAISEKEFITDYDQYYPVEIDLNLLSSLCLNVDAMKCDYILKSIQATIGKSNDSATPSNSIAEPVAGPSGNQNNQSSATLHGFSINNQRPILKPSIELTVLVSEIKDILHDKDEAFIEKCLEYYDFNKESVINAILEDNIPPHLNDVGQTEPIEFVPRQKEPIECYIPPELLDAPTSNLTDRMKELNILDNGEVLVVPRKTVEVPKEYIRKNYSLVDDYDDERDDTYDSCDVRDVAHESLEIDSRPFTTPRVLAAQQKNEAPSEDESEPEEVETTTVQNGKDHFIQNPEDVRARAEQRRQSMRGGKSCNNVVGKPRGQGQDQSTLNNRHQKNTNKATRANHNRRSGASWKRSQGMVPS